MGFAMMRSQSSSIATVLQIFASVVDPLAANSVAIYECYLVHLTTELRLEAGQDSLLDILGFLHGASTVVGAE